MEQKCPARAYISIAGGNKGGPVDRNPYPYHDPSLEEMGDLTVKSELETGSDTRSSTDSAGSEGSSSSITQTTSTTGSEIAIRGSSSSPEKNIAGKEYRRKNDRSSGVHFYDNRNQQFRQRRSDYEMNRTLWVGNVPIWASEQQVMKIFAKVGDVRHVYMPKKPTKKDECKFAFVGYYREESVPRALEELHGATLFGKVLKLAARHGSIHEVHALELEKRRENIAKAQSRKEELKQVRELAKQRMEKAACDDLPDQVCNKDGLGMGTGYDNQDIAMAQTLSTFQRHALEFQERWQRARSSTEEFKKWKSGPSYPEENLTNYLFEVPTGHQKRTVEYKTLSGHSHSTPYERDESPGVEVERVYEYDVDDSFSRKWRHQRGPSYYNNEIAHQAVDHEDRKEKRRLDYDLHQHRRPEKKMRYSRERYSRSLRRDEHKVRHYYSRNSEVRHYRNHPHKVNHNELKYRRKSQKSYARRVENDHGHDHDEQWQSEQDQSRSRRAGSDVGSTSTGTGTGVTGENRSSTLVSGHSNCNNNKRDHHNFSEIDSDESVGSTAGTGSGKSSDKQTSSGPEVAPGSVGRPSTSSRESIANSTSASAAATVMTGMSVGVGGQMRPEDVARMILANLDIDSLNTVAATMGLHVTPTASAAASVNAPIADVDQHDSSSNEAKTNQQQKPDPKSDKIEDKNDGNGKALCRIM